VLAFPAYNAIIQIHQWVIFIVRKIAPLHSKLTIRLGRNKVINILILVLVWFSAYWKVWLGWPMKQRDERERFQGFAKFLFGHMVGL
jgi:hypothetical protein